MDTFYAEDTGQAGASEAGPVTLRPCLGVMCERHQRCARYFAIDGSRVPSEQFLLFCPPPSRPLFVAIMVVPRATSQAPAETG